MNYGLILRKYSWISGPDLSDEVGFAKRIFILSFAPDDELAKEGEQWHRQDTR